MDPTWQQIGNWVLVAFTASYIACAILFLLLRPASWLEWATTLKVVGVAAVGINAVLVVFFAIGTDQPLRVLVLTLATAFCWWFTILSWREWMRRRRP